MDIVEFIKTVFLGIVEGITEWLPISSTGHMILVDEFIKLNVSQDFKDFFLVVIQLGDGDAERPDDEAYANSYFVNANSGTAPGIVDADRNPILERSEVYSGVYGRASINFYAFNSNGNKGIACGLNNLQKIRDGEPLGGKSRAEDDFAEADEEDFLS